MDSAMYKLAPNGATATVTARWHPEDACKPILDEVPAFYPNDEDFKDLFKYISSIRQYAEPYGICRIVPPLSWNPPCLLKERNVWENSSFTTRVQQLDKLQNRKPARMAKRRRISRWGMQCSTSNGSVEDETGYCSEAKEFGFEPGDEFTLEAFQKYADDFKEQYFCMNNDSRCTKGDLQKQWEPSIENIEGEYWRIIQKPTEEIEVLYGADIETDAFGSGFPKFSTDTMDFNWEDKYVKSDWNLNNISRLSGSMLSFESDDISGIMLPWLYVGMCFSSFCWHVEDHHLYSLNYMHWGAPKVWYGVPGKDALKFETAMKKHLPDLFEEQPDLLHKLVTQLSPSIINSEGIPVYCCVQHPREFVLTFPRAYHAGFSSGFNCAEALNIAPVDWLSYGQNAVELYHVQGRKTSLSHDKLLLGAAREAVRSLWELGLLRKETLNNLRWKDVSRENGILTQALKTRVHMECERRKCISLKSMKMDVKFDVNTERECIICNYDLHLSAVGCQCSPGRYACLMHAEQLCSCAWSTRSFLVRYEPDELHLLVKALEGRLSAIHRWANQDLGLALSSYISQRKSQESNQISGLSTEGTKQKEQGLSTATNSAVIADSTGLCKEINTTMSQASSFKVKIEKEQSRLNSTGTILGASLQMLQASSFEVKREKEHTRLNSTGTVIGTFLQQEKINQLPSLCSDTKNMKEPKQNRFSSLANGNAIVNNDNEGEGPHGSITSVKYSCPEILKTPRTNASMENEEDAIPVVERMERLLHSVHMKAGGVGSGETSKNMNNTPMKPFSQSTAYNVKYVSTALERHIEDHAPCKLTNIGDVLRHHHCNDSASLISSCNDENPTLDFSSTADCTARPVAESWTCILKHCDSNYSQEGPCVANAAGINYVVEPLEYGVVLPGKLWSNSKVIFPKGFKSRVRYCSVLDPAKTCYYISQILDAGLLGPVFMVSVEQCPNEVFITFSAAKCWEMVRQRVNLEIVKQTRLGSKNLPSLQPAECLNGLEMFGFSSPEIIQAIEAIDCNRICSEYWKCRPKNQRPFRSLPISYTEYMQHKIKEELDDQEFTDTQNWSTHPGVEILRGLFKKANFEELCSLHSTLSGNKWSSAQEVSVRLLDGEIHSRKRSLGLR